MSELISGKEALIALANGEDVQFSFDDNNIWKSLIYSNVHIKCILNDSYKFRLKPRTITLNGIEVPKPFEPKEGECYFILNPYCDCGYSEEKFSIAYAASLGAWRTEKEIKQVVAALRSVFKGV